MSNDPVTAPDLLDAALSLLLEARHGNISDEWDLDCDALVAEINRFTGRSNG